MLIKLHNEIKLTNEDVAISHCANNVRSPSLVKDGIYIMRMAGHRKTYTIVRFAGCYKQIDNGPVTEVAENFKLKDMVSGDYYGFVAVDTDGKPYDFGCYQFEKYLAAGTSADRVTFFEIKGHENVVREDKPERAPKKLARAKSDTPAVLDTADDNTPLYGVPASRVCNYITEREIDWSPRA